MAVEDVPQWVDKVYSAEMLTQFYDYYGTLKHGWLNSVLGQKDCLKTTDGYNYLAINDDIWVYTGVTSVTSDQSIVGFVLMNQRTKETKFFSVTGAVEASAMGSAEGQVQDLGYVATFPLLLNIDNQPTYFLTLKDGSGLVKKYALVNVQKYQVVAIGDTLEQCQESYHQLMESNHILSETAEEQNALTAAGEIGIMMSHASGGRDAAHSAGGLAHNLRKEVRDVRLTMHIGSFTVTITVKKRGNRHSGK